MGYGTILASMAQEVDGIGVYGAMLLYSTILAMGGSAFLLFLYLWHKGRLDMDEEPKMTVFADEQRPSSGCSDRKEGTR